MKLRALLSDRPTVLGMKDPYAAPHPEKPHHRNQLVRFHPSVQALLGIEVLLGVERGEPVTDADMELVRHVRNDLGSASSAAILLVRWMHRYVTDTRWLVEHMGPHCVAVLLLGPTINVQLFGGWLLIDVELEFENVNDIIYCPRVVDGLVHLMPLPPDHLFEKADDDTFVDPFASD